jgi:hypothetical protein
MTTEPTTVTQPAADKRWTWLPIILLLIGILACGAYFRFGGLNWSQGNPLHPDENFLMQVTPRSSRLKPGRIFHLQTR